MSDPPTTLSPDEAAAYLADAPGLADEPNLLSRITNLVKEAETTQADVARLETMLKAAQDRQRLITEFLLPEAMVEAQQSKLTTLDGAEVELAETIFASIPPANLDRALMFLSANGQAGIIKHEVKLDFGRDESQRAARVLELLKAEGLSPSDKSYVHPMTLKATLKEMLASGVNVDLSLFGAYVRRVARIKRPR